MPKMETTEPKAAAVPTVSKAKKEEKAPARPVLFPKMFPAECWGDTALTGELAAQVLGLETEDAWAVRVAAENGLASTAEEAAKLGLKLSAFSFRDDDGTKVVCGAISKNRPIDMGVVAQHEQDVLTRNWAGPTTIPGETEHVYGGDEPVTMPDGSVVNPGDKVMLPDGTINGEPITIDRFGEVASGQKRLIALWKAWRRWLREPEKWHRFWPPEQYPNGPVLETLIWYGISDHPRVTQTIDNVQPRSLSDTLYTTGAAGRILGVPDESKIEPKKRQEVCRMLQVALEFAWNRSGMGKRIAKTNRTSQEWLDRHPRLYKAVKHVFEVNQGRGLSLLRLSPGTCAAAMFLMAQSKTDPKKWKAAADPGEAQLDITLWAKAEEFWAGMARKDGVFKPLSDALVKLVNQDEDELTGNAVRKFCLIAQAWELFAAGKKIDKDALVLQTFEDADGVTQLLDPPGFGGIDVGPRRVDPNEDPVVSPAEVERAKAEIKNGGAGPIAPAKGEASSSGPVKHDKDGKPPPLKVVKPAAQTSSKPQPNGAPAKAAAPKAPSKPAAKPTPVKAAASK